jgi:hypothetical protein
VAATPAPTSVASLQAAPSPNRLSSRALENAERLDKLP